jgi:hypothetical protein
LTPSGQQARSGQQREFGALQEGLCNPPHDSRDYAVLNVQAAGNRTAEGAGGTLCGQSPKHLKRLS